MQKMILCVIIFMDCAAVSNAQNHKETIEHKLSSYILQHITNNLSSWDSSRNEIINLFVDIFTNRTNLNKEANELSNHLIEETFALLNIVQSDSDNYSDGQDARNGDFKIMVSFMSLAVLSADDTSFIENAKSIGYGNSWYSYPTWYALTIFLDVSLQLDRFSNYSIIIETLNELRVYLSDIIESGNYDEDLTGHIEFINSIIQEIKTKN